MELKNKFIISDKLFFLAIFVFQLILIFQGIDLSDEGFLATFYQEIFKNPESVQYSFMFWLTGILGGLYFKLFPFLGLWGLRFAGVLITTSTAIFVYILLKKYINRHYLMLGIFLVILSLNNDVKELNYNNLSALTCVAVVYFLFNGLKKRSFIKLFICGVFVSLSLFIRPPNILELGFALGIIYYGYVEKLNLKLIAGQVSLFMAGFISGTAFLLIIIYQMGHWAIFLNALEVIYKMGSHIQDDKMKSGSYGIIKLLQQLKNNNVSSVLISLGIFVGVAVGLSIYSIIKNKFLFINRISKLLRYTFLLLILILILVGIINNYSVLFFYTGLITLVCILVLLTPAAFDIRFLMICGYYILITYPFGSDAGIYTAGRYSLWIGLPISIDYIFSIRSVKNVFSYNINEFNPSIKINITENQIRIAKNLLLSILIFAGLYYSFNYPFFDRRNRLKMRYSIDNKLLTGIYTTKGRAETLNELLKESTKYVKKGDYLLAYDCIPMLNFLTETIPYIRSPYPWLYETEIFKYELDLAKNEKKILPVIITQTIQTIGDGSKWPEETLKSDYLKWDVNLGRNKYLDEFLMKNNYKEVWTNNYFRIFVPK